jgi:adenylate cyclase
MIGWCRNLRGVQGWDPGSDAEIAEAMRLARLAIDTGKDDPDALGMAAIPLLNFARDPATAESAADRALALNPNSAFAWGISGWVPCFRYRSERASRLSPLDPLGYSFAAA